LRKDVLNLLEHERQLRDVAALVGIDALEPRDRLVMQVAAVAREVLLRQNVYHPNDASSSPAKTLALAEAVAVLHAACLRAVDQGIGVDAAAFDRARRALDALRESDRAGLDSSRAAMIQAAEAIAPRAPARSAA
jgi:V/A-type H+-transporting ATPase subunit A